MSGIPEFDPSLSFARTFSQAVARRELTLDALCNQLRQAGTPVSSATLSYWQTGRSVPRRATSLRALVALEQVLQVEQGYLVRALGDLGREVSWLPALVVTPEVEHQLERMGLQARRVIDVVNMHDHYRVRDRVVLADHEVRMVIRVQDDGRCSFPVIYQESGCRVAPRVRAGFGARIAQEVLLPEQGLYVGELELVGRLRKDELVPLSFHVDWQDAEMPDMMRHLAGGARCYVMTASFEGAMPEGVAYTFQPAQASDPLQEALLPLRGTTASHVLVNAGVGSHGYDWSV